MLYKPFFKKISLFFLISFFSLKITAQAKIAPPVPLNLNKTLTTIAFGSCNDQRKAQDIWPFILKNKPDLWIWLGDNIYADTENMREMADKYQKQKSAPAYRFFRSKCPVIGIWDDHDFGENDGCRTYAPREKSKHLMLDFLDVPSDAPARKRPGGYQTYTFGPKGKRVRVILLDARYFRDPLELAPIEGSKKKSYKPSPNGTVLGEIQWAWLEKVLSESDADVHLVASGIQILPEEHVYEKWANFPKERQRLLNLLSKICPANPILLSGDRHISEVSEIQLAGFDYPIKEITASGLTHSWIQNVPEPNKYRVGEKVVQKNFAVMTIDWDKRPLSFKVEVKGLANASYGEWKWEH